MKTKYVKVLFSFVLAIVISVSSCLPSFALVGWETRTVNGYTYRFQNTCDIYPATVCSSTRIEETGHNLIPPFYVGLYAALYNQNNQMVATCGDIYNDCNTFSMSIHAVSNVAGTYHSGGIAMMFTGQYDSGNRVYHCVHVDDDGSYPFTPSSTNPSYPESVVSYDTTKSGETYGSASDARSYDEMPDLISAVGDNGISGYVLREDVISLPPTAEATVEHMKNISNKSIPVYDLEGNVIDTFTFSGYYEYNK